MKHETNGYYTPKSTTLPIKRHEFPKLLNTLVVEGTQINGDVKRVDSAGGWKIDFAKLINNENKNSTYTCSDVASLQLLFITGSCWSSLTSNGYKNCGINLNICLTKLFCHNKNASANNVKI